MQSMIKRSKIFWLRNRCSACYSVAGLSYLMLSGKVSCFTSVLNNEHSSSIFKNGDELLYLPDGISLWFDISLAEGRCVGVVNTNEKEIFPVNDRNELGAKEDDAKKKENDCWVYNFFHPSEINYAIKATNHNRNSFWLGRLAIRIALNFPNYPILKDRYGRPLLKNNNINSNTSNIFGSISHKKDRGVALISDNINNGDNLDFILAGVGIDLESTSRPGKMNISKRILTTKEQQSLGNLPGLSVEEEILLRFSLKEAIYKAAHPLLCQYVGFREAEVTPFADGSASCTWLLDTNADKKIAKMTAHWKTVLDGDYFLTSASVYKRAHTSHAAHDII